MLLRSPFPSSIPSLIVAAVLLGASSPALADVAEPEPVPEPEPKPAPEVKTEPAPDAKTEAKTDAKADSKDEAKKGGCSVTDDGASLMGLAALVLLVSGGALLRRKPEQG